MTGYLILSNGQWPLCIVLFCLSRIYHINMRIVLYVWHIESAARVARVVAAGSQQCAPAATTSIFRECRATSPNAKATHYCRLSWNSMFYNME